MLKNNYLVITVTVIVVCCVSLLSGETAQAEILSETTYKTRTPEAIKKDYYRGKKLIQGLTEKIGTQRTF